MDEQHLTLLLLPGLDGTGELFADFVKLTPDWIKTEVVSYPPDKELAYDELLPNLRSKLPSDPFVILAESFSTPLAAGRRESPRAHRLGALCGLCISSSA